MQAALGEEREQSARLLWLSRHQSQVSLSLTAHGVAVQAALGEEREQNARLRSTLAAMRAEMEVLHQQHDKEQQQAACVQPTGPADMAAAPGHEQQAASAAGCWPGQHARAQGLPGHMQHGADRQQQQLAGTQEGAVDQLQQAQAEVAMLRDENERLMELSNALRAELGRAGALLAEQHHAQALLQAPGPQLGPLQTSMQQAATRAHAELHSRWQPTHQDFQLLAGTQQGATQAQTQLQGHQQPLQAVEPCTAPQQAACQQAATVQQRQQLAAQLPAMPGIEGVALQPPQLHQVAVGQLAEPQAGTEVGAESTCKAPFPSVLLHTDSEAPAAPGRTEISAMCGTKFATCLYTCAVGMCCLVASCPSQKSQAQQHCRCNCCQMSRATM